MVKCLSIIFCVFHITLGMVFNKFTLEVFQPSSHPIITNYLNPQKIDAKIIAGISALACPLTLSIYSLSACMIIGILNEKRIGLWGHIAALASLTVSFIYFAKYGKIES